MESVKSRPGFYLSLLHLLLFDLLKQLDSMYSVCYHQEPQFHVSWFAYIVLLVLIQKSTIEMNSQNYHAKLRALELIF